MGLDFVAISFETANDDLASACAVGIVRFRNGVMVDRHSSFINFPRSLGGFDPAKTELHNITPKDLIGAPTWAEVQAKIVSFIGSDYVVAHNTDYHMSVITNAADEAGIPVPDLSHFCTRTLAQRAIPGLTRYRLADISKSLGLGKFEQYDTEAHALLAGKTCVDIAVGDEIDSLVSLMVHNGIREGVMGRGREHVVDGYVEVEEQPVVVPPAPVVAIDKPVAAPAKTETQIAVQPASEKSLELKGQRISFVGGFEAAERETAKKIIAASGGKYLKNVRPDTTMLVIGTHHNPNLEGIVVAKAFNDSGSKIVFWNKEEFLAALP